MDLIKISDNKLKIMLSPVDMQSYELSVGELDCTNMETREAFRNIMKEARDRTGFDTGGNQIYVQVYPSREGGCEMFVTKLGLLCEAGRKAEGERSSRIPGGHSEAADAVSVAFENVEHLLAACRRLKAWAFTGKSTAYRGDEGQYYLMLTGIRGGRPPLTDRRELICLIEEYGTRQNAATTALYIREHAIPICEGEAVARLAEL